MFFSADYWLLAKTPNAFQENIKLVDFFISRLRFIIPIVFCVFFIFLAVYGTLQDVFFNATIITASSLYFSAFIFKHQTKHFKENTLLFWLLMILGISVMVAVIDQYLGMIRIIAAISFVFYGLILVFIFDRIGKGNTKPETENN